MTAIKDAISEFRRGFETSDGEMLVREEPVEAIEEKEVEQEKVNKYSTASAEKS